MKQFILFLVMVLNTGMLYSQTGKESKSDILEGKQVGDTLTGKGVKYKLYRDSDNDLFGCKTWQIKTRPVYERFTRMTRSMNIISR